MRPDKRKSLGSARDDAAWRDGKADITCARIVPLARVSEKKTPVRGWAKRRRRGRGAVVRKTSNRLQCTLQCAHTHTHVRVIGGTATAAPCRRALFRNALYSIHL